MNIDFAISNCRCISIPLLGSQVLTNANNERVCHDIVAKSLHVFLTFAEN